MTNKTLKDFIFFSSLIMGAVLLILLAQSVYADSIHIDDYRPLGKEATITVKSFDIIKHKFQYIPANVTVTVNNVTYSGETNRYGFIAFPIKLIDNVFEVGVYDVIITIGEKVYNDTITVIKNRY